MKVKRPKDFWAGLMFVASGLFFTIWAAENYQMGTAVRMGPAYFPAVLGGLLAVLGAIILLQGVFVRGAPGEAALKLPFNLVDLVIAIAIFGVLVYLSQALGFSSDWAIIGGTIIVSILTVWLRPDAKALVFLTAATIAYGYLMKPLGLIGTTAAVVLISAAGGHEFKWKEVVILCLVLIVFSVLVFVKGLTLPFPICPDFIENCPIR
ncbi:MAG TPA: tripartite tricarboxylate transporter TctB family protein [Burkholderiales bacterium]|nr:tripartite tricarboxylate transporter TctB family protein [Burkholderiales bacterium]